MAAKTAINILNELREALTEARDWGNYEIPAGFTTTARLVSSEIGTHEAGARISEMRAKGFKIHSELLTKAINIHSGQKERIIGPDGKKAKVWIYTIKTPEKYIDFETGELNKFKADLDAASEKKTIDLFKDF